MTHVAKRISIAIIIALVVAIALSMFSLPQKMYADSIPAVGEDYGGGEVAYILQSGDPGYEDGKVKGLIAATSDDGSYIVWALSGFYYSSVPGGTSRDLWTGSQNTNNIIIQNGAGTYAASVARAYNGGGYNDWFLPSRDEVAELFASGILTGDIQYWSSSEYYSSYALAYSGYGGGGHGAAFKYQFNRVRPVRYFEITLETESAKSDSAEEPAEPAPWVRDHEMTCYQVWINENNNFEFVFFWEYKNNNWVKIYDIEGNEVFSIDMKKGSAQFEANLPDGMYTVKTFHNGFETPIQEFLIGKP